VDSEPGRTVFRATLPMTESDATAPLDPAPED
jgi:nitrogen-specific signal transduction histidine kinase